VVATPFPLLLLLAARASKIRGAATIAAATYTLIYIGMILVASAVSRRTQNSRPFIIRWITWCRPAFPLLLIVPAIAIDWLFLSLLRDRKRNHQSFVRHGGLTGCSP
jgi:hypothetical protein